jgi:hypothetical protein
MELVVTNIDIARPITRACGKVGTAIWEEEMRANAPTITSVLVGVSDGFYMRVTKTLPWRMAIVCESCGRICSTS